MPPKYSKQRYEGASYSGFYPKYGKYADDGDKREVRAWNCANNECRNQDLPPRPVYGGYNRPNPTYKMTGGHDHLR